MPKDFDSLARPVLAALLQPGEVLRAVTPAVHQKTFSGQQYAIGVTDRRLILQPVDRHIAANGAPVVVTPESIDSVRLDGAGDGWWTAPIAVLDASAVTLDLRTRDGRRIKLMMMRSSSVVALAEWLSQNVIPRSA